MVFSPYYFAQFKHEVLSDKQDIVESVRAESVPLGLHYQARSTEEALHTGGCRGGSEIPGGEGVRKHYYRKILTCYHFNKSVTNWTFGTKGMLLVLPVPKGH